MDDGTLVAPLPTLDAIFPELVGKLVPLGLQVNLSKTTIWGPAALMIDTLPNSSLLRAISVVPYVPNSGITLLGVPVHFPGTPAYLLERLRDTVLQVRRSCTVLTTKLRDTQTQLALIRGCFAACKFTFLL